MLPNVRWGNQIVEKLDAIALLRLTNAFDAIQSAHCMGALKDGGIEQKKTISCSRMNVLLLCNSRMHLFSGSEGSGSKIVLEHLRQFGAILSLDWALLYLQHMHVNINTSCWDREVRMTCPVPGYTNSIHLQTVGESDITYDAADAFNVSSKTV